MRRVQIRVPARKAVVRHLLRKTGFQFRQRVIRPAERRAVQEGKPIADGALPMVSSGLSELRAPEGTPIRGRNAFVPVCLLVRAFIVPSSWFELAFAAAIGCATYLGALVLFCLQPSERQDLGKMGSKFRRFRPGKASA